MNKDYVINTASIVITCTLLAAGVVGGLYWAACQLSLQTLRALVVALVVALPIVSAVTWRLATNAAREHLRGVERGLKTAEETVDVMGRSLGAASRHIRAAVPPQPDNSDLLPRVGAMRVIEAQRGGGELEVL